MLSLSFNAYNLGRFGVSNLYFNSRRVFVAIALTFTLAACDDKSHPEALVNKVITGIDTDTTAPQITSGNTVIEIDENSGAAQVIYTVTSDDSTATYALSGTDSALFTIDASTGAVTLTGNPSFNTKSSYSFVVTATDTAGNDSSITVTLTINDKTAPTITSGTTATAIDENSGAAQVIYTATSDDSTATYALSGTDRALFAIDASTGAVTLTGNPDFEVKSSYSFTVTATDEAGNSSSPITATLAINDIALASFSLGSIAPSSGDIKEMTLTWDSAALTDEQSITYTICKKDTTKDNNCNQLTSVTDVLTANATVSSLVDALSADYFVLASFKGEFEPSSDEANLSADNVNKMIGYFKASNTGQYDYFGHSVALSGDGHTLAVGAYFESNSASGVITDKSEALGDKDAQTITTSGAVYLFSNSSGKWLQTAYVKASNPGVNDQFGDSVALNNDGTILAVGAAYEKNSNASGVITDGSEISDDDNGGPEGSGAVYLFNKNNDVWAQTAYIKAPIPSYLASFGVSVKLSGDGTILAVGADDQGSGTGAVYLFSNSDDVWAQTASLQASNAEIDDHFGHSIALSDDGATLAVGAYEEGNGATGVITDGSEVGGDVAASDESGAVYLFNKSNDVWSQTAYVKASNTGSGDFFGYSVALSGDGTTLAVGAYNEDYNATGVTTNSPTVSDIDDGAAERSGAVYLFNKSENVWSQTAYVKASNTEDADFFGYSVALSFDGARLVVGAFTEDNVATGVITDGSEVAGDVTTAIEAGAVYLFDKSSDGWSQTAYVKASNPEGADLFGYSVTLSDDGATLAVGAAQEDQAVNGIITDGSEINGDVNTTEYAGAVYVY